ncbi:hypothetical protein BDW66DRAFT_122682 [Aspergillus desertorum]
MQSAQGQCPFVQVFPLSVCAEVAGALLLVRFGMMTDNGGAEISPVEAWKGNPHRRSASLKYAVADASLVRLYTMCSGHGRQCSGGTQGDGAMLG